MTTQFQTADEIATLLSARLATIREVNGYETEIGARVFRGVRKVEDDQVPCAVLIEGGDTVEQSKSRVPSARIQQDYILGGYTTCDPANPNDAAHAVIRDLKKVIFAGDATLGGKVPIIEYRGRDIGPRTDGVPIVFALIEITVTYVEDLTNP